MFLCFDVYGVKMVRVLVQVDHYVCRRSSSRGHLVGVVCGVVVVPDSRPAAISTELGLWRVCVVVFEVSHSGSLARGLGPLSELPPRVAN